MPSRNNCGIRPSIVVNLAMYRGTDKGTDRNRKDERMPIDTDQRPYVVGTCELPYHRHGTLFGWPHFFCTRCPSSMSLIKWNNKMIKHMKLRPNMVHFGSSLLRDNFNSYSHFHCVCMCVIHRSSLLLCRFGYCIPSPIKFHSVVHWHALHGIVGVGLITMHWKRIDPEKKSENIRRELILTVWELSIVGVCLKCRLTAALCWYCCRRRFAGANRPTIEPTATRTEWNTREYVARERKPNSEVHFILFRTIASTAKTAKRKLKIMEKTQPAPNNNRFSYRRAERSWE